MGDSLGRRRVVFTCMFGSSECFNDFPYDDNGTIDFICFTDDPDLAPEHWRPEVVAPGLLDSGRSAKQVKILAHRFLSGYDESLYVDNVVHLKAKPADIFRWFLPPDSPPLVCFSHPERRCVYDEANVVIAKQYDDPQRVRSQMNFYRQLGYPASYGLNKGGFLLRRHGDAEVVRCMETWFMQVLVHSCRDQLSLPVAMWWHGLKPGLIDLDFLENDILEWPYPVGGSRLPRDFDDQLYLELNPDLTASGLNPRKHFLNTGMLEGRPYK